MLKQLMSLFAVVLLVACEDTGQSATEAGPSTPVTDSANAAPAADLGLDLPSSARLIASSFRSIRDTNLGSDVVIRDARAEGSIVIIDLQIVVTRVRYNERLARVQLRQLVCGDETLRRFVDAGGRVQFDIFMRAGAREGSPIVSSC